MERKRFILIAILASSMALFASGCAASKCDCPSFHGKTQTEQQPSV